MPIHDWTRVDAGIFHAFHLEWISSLTHTLNESLLPDEYYALQEQSATRLGPDVLTLRRTEDAANAADEDDADSDVAHGPAPGGTALCPPRLRPIAQTDLAFYRKKQNAVVVRHASGDDVVAVIEIVSRGNKSAASAFRAFVEKAARLLDGGIHLLILDLQPPGRRDPSGIHGAIWEEIDGSEYLAPPEKPLTLVSYEAAAVVGIRYQRGDRRWFARHATLSGGRQGHRCSFGKHVPNGLCRNRGALAACLGRASAVNKAGKLRHSTGPCAKKVDHFLAVSRNGSVVPVCDPLPPRRGSPPRRLARQERKFDRLTMTPPNHLTGA